MKRKLLEFINSKFFRFLFVAVLSIVFELAVFTLLFTVIRADPVLSSPIAQVFSMIFNFTLNKLFTFKTEKKHLVRETVGYFIVWLINVGISTALIAIVLGITDIYPTIVRFGIIVIMFFLNFYLLKTFVFNKGKSEQLDAINN